MRQLFAFWVGIIFLASGFCQAQPKAWSQLADHFYGAVSSHGKLKPNFQKSLEFFFANVIDRERDQLLYVENDLGSRDTLLDFLAFRSYGILKRVTYNKRSAERKIQLATEHLFHLAILRLDRLSYEELCYIIHQSMQGKYNLFRTLTENNLRASRDRLLYFLIDKLSNQFEAESSQRTGNIPSLIELTKTALNDDKVRADMNSELHLASQPLVSHWEDVPFISNFFEQAMNRRFRVSFLRQIMEIANNLDCSEESGC